MGYHLIDPDELEQWDDRDADVRSLSTAAGLDYHDSKLGLRLYQLEPGQQAPLHYHAHDEQVEVFFVLEGTLHVETPDQEYIVNQEQALVVEPGHPQRAFNPEHAAADVRILAIGAPSVDDARRFTPD